MRDVIQFSSYEAGQDCEKVCVLLNKTTVHLRGVLSKVSYQKDLPADKLIHFSSIAAPGMADLDLRSFVSEMRTSEITSQ